MASLCTYKNDMLLGFALTTEPTLHLFHQFFGRNIRKVSHKVPNSKPDLLAVSWECWCKQRCYLIEVLIRQSR